MQNALSIRQYDLRKLQRLLVSDILQLEDRVFDHLVNDEPVKPSVRLFN